MFHIGVQTHNVVNDRYPEEGFTALARAGFSCADFSLNAYLDNSSIHQANINSFFNRTILELENFFTPHKLAAQNAGITINQLHMPYPIFIPGGNQEINDYLWHEVAVKSLQICAFLKCPYIVVHGFKLARYLGAEEKEWERTEAFLHFIAPQAKELGVTICMENLYDSTGGHLMEGPGYDARKAAERIDRFNDTYHAQVLGFCFDTGHANLVGLDFEDFITTLGHRLKVLHIHDNDGIGDLHQIPYTFSRARENKASTDWEGFIRGLGRIHYEKVLSFETAPVLTAFPEQMKNEVLGFIARLGEYFAGEIHALS